MSNRNHYVFSIMISLLEIFTHVTWGIGFIWLLLHGWWGIGQIIGGIGSLILGKVFITVLMLPSLALLKPLEMSLSNPHTNGSARHAFWPVIILNTFLTAAALTAWSMWCLLDCFSEFQGVFKLGSDILELYQRIPFNNLLPLICFMNGVILAPLASMAHAEQNIYSLVSVFANRIATIAASCLILFTDWNLAEIIVFQLMSNISLFIFVGFPLIMDQRRAYESLIE